MLLLPSKIHRLSRGNELVNFSGKPNRNRPEEDGGLGQLPTDEAVVGAVDLCEGLFQQAGPELIGISTCEEEDQLALLGGEPVVYDDLPPLPRYEKFEGEGSAVSTARLESLILVHDLLFKLIKVPCSMIVEVK
jgi:hypothetical protein